MKKGWFFGVPILLGKRAELQRAAETCLSHHGILHTVNPLMLSYALTNVSFRRVLRDGVNMPDGVGIKLSFLLKGEKTDVYPGIDLCETLFAKAKSVVFYGAEKGVAQRAFETLAKKHQNAPTACFFDGFETKREEVEAALHRQKPDLVFVALGTPRQEREMQKLYDAYPLALYVGVGGAFDVWAGDRQRAPRAVRTCGLEWLYRMGKEPKRLKNLPRLLLFSAASVLGVFRRFRGRGKSETFTVSIDTPNKNIVKN